MRARVTVTIRTGNAAMLTAHDVAGALGMAADRLLSRATSEYDELTAADLGGFPLLDDNGGEVGTLAITRARPPRTTH